TYSIMLGTFDATGGPITFNVALAPAIAAPVLSRGTLQSSAVQLNWTATAPSTGFGFGFYELEQCSGSGCTDFANIATLGPTTRNVGGLTPNAVYRFRVRATHTLYGDGPWSNVLQVVPPTGPFGSTQYAFAVGAVGSFWRRGNVAFSGASA